MAKRRSREGTCSVEGCDQPIKALGWCDAHYSAARRHKGDPLGRRVAGICSVEDCGRTATANGLCGQHYKAAKRHDGDPLGKYVPAICSVEGCERSAYAKGFCQPHYRVAYRHNGDPTYRRPVPEPRSDMLTAEQVRLIQHRRGKTPPADLASEFGTTIRTIIAIQAGRNWGWLAK